MIESRRPTGRVKPTCRTTLLEGPVVKRNVITSTVLLLVAALAVLGVVVARPDTRSPGPVRPSVAPVDAVVRDDSHRLSPAPAGSPVFVEFLDLECEACRAAFPLVEQLREDYAGRVEFVIRYFPIDAHANAMNAALATEAAARQGRLEEMYTRMYQTQASWGERQDSQAATFRDFAKDLGLDLARFDADVASASVRARVEKDRQDGLALGVQGTPTFFLDGRMVQPRTEGELRSLLDAAVRR